MTVELSWERTYRVLKLAFHGEFTAEDLDAIDPALLRFMAGAGREIDGMRCLYDMTAVTALAVPPGRFAHRAQMPPPLQFGRVVVPFAGAPADFGKSYREMRGATAHQQPLIVPTLEIAYGYLGIEGVPHFEAVN